MSEIVIPNIEDSKNYKMFCHKKVLNAKFY